MVNEHLFKKRLASSYLRTKIKAFELHTVLDINPNPIKMATFSNAHLNRFADELYQAQQVSKVDRKSYPKGN